MDAHKIINNSNFNSFTILTEWKISIQAINIYNSNHPLVQLASRQKIVSVCWISGHVRVAGNVKADAEAKAVANSTRRIYNRNIPHKDYFPYIKSSSRNLWQQEWTLVRGNKLRDTKSNINAWPLSCHKQRMYEIILSRLIIGHTNCRQVR